MKRWIMVSALFCLGVAHAATVTSQLDENRILLFDDYYLTNNLPQPTWVHEGGNPPQPPTATGGLLAGSNHYHRTGWVLLNCRIGQRNNPTTVMYVPPQHTATVTNYSANLMNRLDAAIYSPVFSNGIGTLYFETINTVSVPGIAAGVAVDIATNMIGGAALSGSMTHANVDWREMLSTNLYATSINDFVRMIGKLEIRQPVALRIRRSAVNGTAPDNYYICVDNIRVSPTVPPLLFENINAVVDSGGTYVECDISNVPGTGTPTDHTSRDVVLWYRWFSPSMTLQWSSVAMSYVPATGMGGDGEKWKATLAFEPAMALEYYFAYLRTPVYQSPDYTGKGYPYLPELDTRRYPEKNSLGRGRSMMLLW